jgi:hypothetical protein
MSEEFETIPTQELVMRYSKGLETYAKFLVVIEHTTRETGKISKELHIIQEELTKRGIKIKDIEDGKNS